VEVTGIHKAASAGDIGHHQIGGAQQMRPEGEPGAQRELTET